MLFPRFRRGATPGTISALYGMIVAQARLPSFYREYAVGDTVNGRFELLVLHLGLVLDRLSQDASLKPLGQGLFDRFCQDMDHNLREMGVGDLKVPAEMRRMGEAYYGRSQAYQAALAAADGQALVEAVRRNIYAGQPPDEAAAGRLATYIRLAARDLGAQETDSLAGGSLRFPDPALIPN
jgi:cytochrome b pre-mRNA-processing protein 3